MKIHGDNICSLQSKQSRLQITVLCFNIISWPNFTVNDAEYTLHCMACHTMLERQWRSEPGEAFWYIEKKMSSHIFQNIKPFAEITYKNIATAQSCWNELPNSSH